ncbi:MAG: co-chaperone DjlA [Pseudomonadota bacterium]|nr:MAG: co-chaperone DjlA [Pseudomonadota bacterium]
MSWWGKIIGGAFGFALGGPLGALLGAAVGHQFDRGISRSIEASAWHVGDVERTQTAFFTAVFSVMGYLAKADGRVSEDEIQMARALMDQMALNEQQRRVAIELLREGKQPEFPLDDALDQLRRECRRRRSLLQMFVEVLLHAAHADGDVHPREREVLTHVCQRLGFSRAELAHLEALVHAQWVHQRGFSGAGGSHRAHHAPSETSLQEAYAVLGVGKDASDAEVKKAYRRMMNQHHPDKLVAKGLPEEMIKLATEKTQEIKSAYEQIKRARGTR